MRTPYGKLAVLIIAIVAVFMLFMPMRAGIEDRIYANPQTVNLHRGDTYAIPVRLESLRQQVVTFSSTNEGVARVNRRGVVTAVSAGSADIHMLAQDGARGVLHVEVVGSPVISLSLSADSLEMEKGQVSGLKAIFNDSADEKLVEWISADESVAIVDAIGRVTAVGGGKTRVIATTPGGMSASATVSVHVAGTALHVTPDNLVLGVGSSIQMGTYFFPDDTTDDIVRWSSNNTAVATMTNDGTLRATGEGTAVISAFSQAGLGGSTIINVEKSASRFTVSPAAATIERGDVITLTPSFLNAGGQPETASEGHYIQWTSSSPDVASVNDGVVTALRSGTTRIIASADGMTAECNLRVQVLVHEVSFNAREIFLLREHTNSPIQLDATISPADADNPKLTFTTNNDLVANVTQSGLVTLTGGYGTAIITATADGGAQATFTINVVTQLPEGITTYNSQGKTREQVEAERLAAEQAAHPSPTPIPDGYAIPEDELNDMPIDITLEPSYEPTPTPIAASQVEVDENASFSDIEKSNDPEFDIFGDRFTAAPTTAAPDAPSAAGRNDGDDDFPFSHDAPDSDE